MTLNRRRLISGFTGMALAPIVGGESPVAANPLAAGLIFGLLRAFVARSIATRTAATGLSSVAEAAVARSVASVAARGYRATRQWVGTYGGRFLEGAAEGAGGEFAKHAIEGFRHGSGVVSGSGSIGANDDVVIAEFPNGGGVPPCRLAWPDIYGIELISRSYLSERARFNLPYAADGDLLVSGLYPYTQVEYPSHDELWHSLVPTVFSSPLYEIRISCLVRTVRSPQISFTIYDRYLKMIKYQNTFSAPEGYIHQ